MPGMRTALLSGALLAFALSFDEVIVTLFTAGAGHADDPDLGPRRDAATDGAAGRQRRRARADRSCRRHPGLHRPAHQRRRGRWRPVLTRSSDAPPAASAYAAPRPARAAGPEQRGDRDRHPDFNATSARLAGRRHRRRGRPRRRHRGRRRRVPHERARRGHRQRRELRSRDAPFYFEVRLEPSEAQDAALREFLGRFPRDRGGRPRPAPLRPADRDARRDARRQRHRLQLVGGRRAMVRRARRRGDARVSAGGAGPDHDGAEMLGSPSAVVLVASPIRPRRRRSIDRILAESETAVTFTEPGARRRHDPGRRQLRHGLRAHR